MSKAAEIKKRRTWRGGSEPKFLLSGIAKCGVCGGPMRHYRYKRGARYYDFYRCHKPGDHTLGRNVAFLDGLAVDELMKVRFTARPGDRLYALALEKHPREWFDRLPTWRRREILHEALTVRVLPVGKGRRRNKETVLIERKRRDDELAD